MKNRIRQNTQALDFGTGVHRVDADVFARHLLSRTREITLNLNSAGIHWHRCHERFSRREVQPACAAIRELRRVVDDIPLVSIY